MRFRSAAVASALMLILYAANPVSAASEEPNGPSGQAVISADGRHVAFYSDASNLVSGDANGLPDLFVKDLSQGTLRRVSGGMDGTSWAFASGSDWMFGGALPAISDDGRLVAYVEGRGGTARYPDFHESVIVDTSTGARTVIPNVLIANPVFSGDGRYLVFTEPRSFNFGNQPINGVMLFDSVTQTLVRVGGEIFSLSDISADGRFVVYDSCGKETVDDEDSPLHCNGGTVDVFLWDRLTGLKTLISKDIGEFTWTFPSISGDGSTIVFSHPGGALAVWHRDTGVANVLLGPEEAPWRADIDKSGCAVCYSTSDGEIKIRDLVTNETRTIASRANAEMSRECRLSAVGTRVVFSTAASNIVPPDENQVSDVFVATTGAKKLTYLRASAL